MKPLGFALEDKQLLRAGLDYHEFASIAVHASWEECVGYLQGRRLFAVSTKGKQSYDLPTSLEGDVFVFRRRGADCRSNYWRTFPNNAVSAFPWFRQAEVSICRIPLRWRSTKHGVRWVSETIIWDKAGFSNFGLRFAVQQRFHRLSCRYAIMNYAAYRRRDRHFYFYSWLSRNTSPAV